MARAAKSRKTFKYLAEEDASPAAVIDEQEQEEVIESLASQDASITTTYKEFFVAIPLLCAVYYLLSGLSLLLRLLLLGTSNVDSNNNATNLLQHALGLASLLTTTALAASIPSPSPSSAANARGQERPGILSSTLPPAPRWLRPGLHAAQPYLRDVGAYLGGVACVVAHYAASPPDDDSSDAAGAGAGSLSYDVRAWAVAAPPIFLFGMVWLARRELRPVDVGALRDLTYNYKGA